MTKKLIDMNNSELFSVLAGDYGIVPRALLCDIITKYEKRFGHRDELTTMVREFV